MAACGMPPPSSAIPSLVRSIRLPVQPATIRSRRQYSRCGHRSIESGDGYHSKPCLLYITGHVENLTLTSYFHVDGSGNLLDNVIVGNSGHNKLVGSVNDYWGGGRDTLQGGAGDDTYTVIGSNDVVIEASNAGIDTVLLIGDANRGWSYTLPDNVENLTANAANQVIFADRLFTGNALNNSHQGRPRMVQLHRWRRWSRYDDWRHHIFPRHICGG